MITKRESTGLGGLFMVTTILLIAQIASGLMALSM